MPVEVALERQAKSEDEEAKAKGGKEARQKSENVEEFVDKPSQTIDD